MSSRAIARKTHLSPQSVQNRLDRLSRQALALHASLRPLANPHESVCIDGFVSFDRSQFFPNELTFSITNHSRFILELSHASKKRSGSLTPSQKQTILHLYKNIPFEKNAIARSFSDILSSLALERPPSPRSPLILITDEKPDYPRSLYRHPLFSSQNALHRVAHITVNSHLPRTFFNPLFPSNYLDRELRKDIANHRRESTCFSRNAANALSRLACWIAYHNYWKKFLIKAPVADTRVHATAAGIPLSLLSRKKSGFFESRVFLSHLSLTPSMERIWRKLTATPGLNKISYLPAFALA
jgi:hypothetical protein